MKKLEYVIKIPAINETRRFRIPDNMPIEKCISLIQSILYEEYPQLSKEHARLCFYMSESGGKMDAYKCLKDYGILTGDVIILA